MTEREILLKTIELLGASVASYKNRPDVLIVAHPYQQPFVIDFGMMTVAIIMPDFKKHEPTKTP